MRLTDEQRRAVDTPGHLCLVSCPGSGKTRAIVAKLLVCIDSVRRSTRHVACITHTNAAADEVDARLRQLCFGDEDAHYEVATIHAFALRNILQPFHVLLPELRGGFKILTPDSDTFGAKVKVLVAAHKLRKVGLDEFEGVQRAPNGYIYPQDLLPKEVQREWCAWLDANSFVTLNDIVYQSCRIILAHMHVASALASRFAWILVDEFQDSSPSQIAILKAIHQFGRTSFFCVGDPNQSIYRFAGASPELLTKFAAHVGANTEHRLTGNFRSSRTIIERAERLCPSDPPMQPVGAYSDFAAHPVHVKAESSAEGIFDHFLPAVKELGVPLGEVAILAPWWLSLFKLAQELRAQGIPAVGPGARPYKRSNLLTQLVESVGAYLESPEPEIGLAVQRALFILLTNFSDNSPASVFDYRGRVVVCKLLEQANISRLANSLAVDWLDDATLRFARILVEAEFIAEEAADGLTGAAALLRDDILSRDGGDALKIVDLGIFARPKHCIQLLTIHKAKGREFEAVAVIDAHDGRLPHFSDANLSDAVERTARYDESRRVVYVAATRAKRVLMFVTDSSNSHNTPTPFLAEMLL